MTVLALCALLLRNPFASGAAPGLPSPAVQVRSNQLVDASGTPVRLLGVNRSGTEYACVIGGPTGASIFNGPSDRASIAAITAWGVNAVRVSLNEDCWLGINGVNPKFSGVRYRRAITGYVDRLNRAGLVAILDLHWSAPGTTLSTGQEVMADADHAPAFWASVARNIGDRPGVMFDLFNEPHDISWSCWQRGCTTAAGWRAAGMQELVDSVRRTGASQAIILAGLDHGNDLSGWQSHRVRDPLHQLVAGLHLYDATDASGYCGTPDCWQQSFARVARTIPVVTTEFGQRDGGSDLVATYLRWADDQWRRGRSVSALAWAWDAAQAEGAPSLITSFDGAPTGYGRGVKAAFALSRTFRAAIRTRLSG